MIRIYLAGCTDEVEYRKEVKEKYGKEFDLVDPMEDIPKDISTIPFRDLDLIDSCNYVLAYVNKPSFGTSMEIFYSFENFISCIFINPDLRFKYDPWIFSHCKFITHDLESGFEFIRKNVKLNNNFLI